MLISKQVLVADKQVLFFCLHRVFLRNNLLPVCR